jgi:protein TonB
MRKLVFAFFFLNSVLAFAQNDTTNEVFTIVEKMPVFPGGDEARAMYIYNNLVFPQKYKGTGISGTVYVNFIVSATGKVMNVSVLRGVPDAPEYDAEAVRLVSAMPAWIPGEQNGKKVAVTYNLPIKFTSRKDPVPTEKKNK